MVWFSIAIKGETASCVLLGHPRVVFGDALALCWVSEGKMKLCLHLFRSVESFNEVSEGPLHSAFSLNSSGSSLDLCNYISDR